MRYFLLLIIAITLRLQTVAQGTLHAVLIADTRDAAAAEGRRENLRRMLAETDTISQFTGLVRQEYILQDEQVSRAGIENTISGMECGAKDVVLFYFSGSEYLGKAARVEGQVLDLPDKIMPLEALCELVGRKKPRLFLIVVDLCNRATSEPIATPLQAASREKYIALFSESAGEISGANHFPREQFEIAVAPNGSIFTQAFLEALHENRPQPLWSGVISRSRFLTVERSGGRQNPQVKNAITVQAGERIDGKPTEYEIVQATPQPVHNDDHNFSRAPQAPAVKEPPATKGGNFIKRDHGSSGVLEPAQLARFKEEGAAQVAFLQEKIARLTQGSSSNSADGKTEAEIIEAAMLLFSDNNREVEISHLSRAKARVKVKKYFSRLYGMGNRYRLEVAWYKPVEMEEFRPQADGSFKAYATIYQEFRKTTSGGKLVYGDRSIKKVDVLLKPEGGTWKIVIGDIKIVEGSTESINE